MRREIFMASRGYYVAIHILTVWKRLARLAPDQPHGWTFPDARKRHFEGKDVIFVSKSGHKRRSAPGKCPFRSTRRQFTGLNSSQWLFPSCSALSLRPRLALAVMIKHPTGSLPPSIPRLVTPFHILSWKQRATPPSNITFVATSTVVMASSRTICMYIFSFHFCECRVDCRAVRLQDPHIPTALVTKCPLTCQLL
jgi:hypothetical protein